MRTLSIDLETYSELDIRKAGLYKYAENCEILLFAYAFDNEPVKIIDMGMVGKSGNASVSLFSAETEQMGRESIPEEVLNALLNKDIRKMAYNAAFERTVLSRYLGRELNPAQWYCTMVQGYTLGMPGGLDMVGKVIGLSEDKQKLAIGKRLIQYFCKPCKPTRANGQRTRNLPTDDPQKWQLFKEYCIRDVEAERAIRDRLKDFEPGPRERELWCLDQKINDAGVLLDMSIVNNALAFDERLRAEWLDEAHRISGLSNPNSNQQILDWVNAKLGTNLVSLDKEARAGLLDRQDLPDEVRKVVILKNRLAKTSIRKYEAMRNARCRDGRVHGMLQFYGANRTGRWAGRLVQLHNLPQNHLEDLDGDRNMVRQGMYEVMSIMYSNPADVLSQLIRTAFVAENGKRFIVADFSAIEARVIAWLADEKWRMETFAKGGDIYCASASQMFHVPVVKHGENGHLRAKGKIAELACGYGGGVSALKAFGADKMGMTEEEMTNTITHWRKASPNICQMWRDVEKCARRAIRTKIPVSYKKGMQFHYQKGILFIRLASQRSIAYVRPRLLREEGRDQEAVTYEGITEKGGWGRVYTWGGKLVENIVQATARDCLAEAMLRLDHAGYKIVMHVHDEVILEMPYGTGSLEEACEIMGQSISWAPGLLLRADGYETEYYKKD